MRRAEPLQALGLLLRWLLAASLALGLQAVQAADAPTGHAHHGVVARGVAQTVEQAPVSVQPCAAIGPSSGHAAVACSHCTGCAIALPVVLAPACGDAGWQAVHVRAPALLPAGRTVAPETPPPIA